MSSSTKDLINYLQYFVNEQRIKLIDEKLLHRTRYVSVVVENVFQTNNASAILRSCECFGIQNVYIIENNNRFCVNDEIAMGSEKWLTIKSFSGAENNTRDAILSLKNEGYRIVATCFGLNSVPLQSFDFSKGKIAFLLGTELTGLSEEALNYCDEFLTIPMVGFTQSLNVSVVAGILLHYATLKIYNSSIPWQLSEEEKNEIKLDWIKKSIKKGDLIEQYYNAHQKKI
jgi:tRNA (guanosine-2'-O-)-methyltransferase